MRDAPPKKTPDRPKKLGNEDPGCTGVGEGRGFVRVRHFCLRHPHGTPRPAPGRGSSGLACTRGADWEVGGSLPKSPQIYTGLRPPRPPSPAQLSPRNLAVALGL